MIFSNLIFNDKTAFINGEFMENTTIILQSVNSFYMVGKPIRTYYKLYYRKLKRLVLWYLNSLFSDMLIDPKISLTLFNLAFTVVAELTCSSHSLRPFSDKLRRKTTDLLRVAVISKP